MPPYLRNIVRAYPQVDKNVYKQLMGYISTYAGEDTPLGYIELGQWYWKHDFPEFWYYIVNHKGKFILYHQEEFFKINLPG